MDARVIDELMNDRTLVNDPDGSCIPAKVLVSSVTPFGMLLEPQRQSSSCLGCQRDAPDILT